MDEEEESVQSGYCPLTGRSVVRSPTPAACRNVRGQDNEPMFRRCVSLYVEIYISCHHFMNVWVDVACVYHERSQEERGHRSPEAAGSFRGFEGK